MFRSEKNMCEVGNNTNISINRMLVRVSLWCNVFLWNLCHIYRRDGHAKDIFCTRRQKTKSDHVPIYTYTQGVSF